MSSKRDQFLTACRNAKLDTVRWGVGAGCYVLSADGDSLQCQGSPTNVAGTHAIEVASPATGDRGLSHAVLTVRPVVESVSPTRGSLGGAGDRDRSTLKPTAYASDMH